MKIALILLSVCVLNAQSSGPITIEQAIQEAMEKNLDVAAERLNISIAEARQITARLRPNPVVSVSGNHLDLLGTGYGPSNNAGPNEMSVRTDFVFERGGKRDARVALASAGKTVAELGLRETMRRLIFDVQSAFVDVQLAKEDLALAKENLSNLNGIVSINAARVKNGDLAAVDLGRSQVAALQYQTAVRQAELQVQQAKTRLQLLLGRSAVSFDFDVSGPIRRENRLVEQEQIREQALRQRPDLLSIQQSQARSQADLRLQLAQGKIDYTIGTEYVRQQASGLAGNSLGFYLSAPLPVFNRNQGEIARAQREREQAVAQLKALEARIAMEAVSAWQQYSSARTLLAEMERTTLPTATSVLRTTEYSYRRGEATLLEFLDAQRAFNESIKSYNEVRGSFARSLYFIDAVTAASVVAP